jgi:hypothetical protein
LLGTGLLVRLGEDDDDVKLFKTLLASQRQSVSVH